jgi:hypothetical protein
MAMAALVMLFARKPAPPRSAVVAAAPRMVAANPPLPPKVEPPTVEVRSSPPGAIIFVDGKPRGITPSLVSLELPAEVELRLDGYRPTNEIVKTAAGVNVTLLRLSRHRHSIPTRQARPVGHQTLD